MDVDSFVVLSDPSRRRIVEMLARGPKNAGAIQREFALSQPAVSQHLKVLRDSGLVNVRVDAQRRIYSLRQEPLDELEAWVQTIKRYWAKRIEKMDDELSNEDQS